MLRIWRDELEPYAQLLDERKEWLMEAAGLLRSGKGVHPLRVGESTDIAADRLEQFVWELHELRMRMGGERVP
jgi:hypothetical protein